MNRNMKISRWGGYKGDEKKKKKKVEWHGKCKSKKVAGGDCRHKVSQLDEIRNHVFKWSDMKRNASVLSPQRSQEGAWKNVREKRVRMHSSSRRRQSDAATSVYLQRLWRSCIIIRDRVTSRGSQVLDLTCVPEPDVARDKTSKTSKT